MTQAEIIARREQAQNESLQAYSLDVSTHNQPFSKAVKQLEKQKLDVVIASAKAIPFTTEEEKQMAAIVAFQILSNHFTGGDADMDTTNDVLQVYGYADYKEWYMLIHRLSCMSKTKS
jgi:hypothetical protein